MKKVFENEAKHAKFKMKRLRQVKSFKEVPLPFCSLQILRLGPFTVSWAFFIPLWPDRPLRSAHVGMLMRARYVFLQSDVSSPKIPGLTIICDSVTKVFEN